MCPVWNAEALVFSFLAGWGPSIVKPPLSLEKQWFAQGHRTAQGQPLMVWDSDPNLPIASPRLVSGRKLCQAWGRSGFTKGVRKEARAPFHCSKDFKEKKLKKKQSCGTKLPADLAGSKSVLSPLLHALARIPRKEDALAVRLWIDAYFFHWQKTNAKPYFSYKKFKWFILLSQVFIKLLLWVQKETVVLSDRKASRDTNAHLKDTPLATGTRAPPLFPVSIQFLQT